MADKQDVQEFLEAIRLLESSGGKNLDHAPVAHGPYKGQVALGSYGMLPTTIDEFAGREQSRLDKDPKILALKKDPQAVGSDAETERKLAERIAEHVINRQGGDLKKSAHAWNTGHNMSPDKISDEMLSNSDYANKFMEAYAPKFTKVKKSLKK